MVRMFACALVVLGLAATGPVRAAATDPAPTATPSITPAQAQQVLDVLNDPAKRAAFAATLEAVVKGLPATTPTAAKPAAASPATGLPIQLAPDSIGARVLMGASSFLEQAENRAMAAITAVRGLPALGRWVTSQLDNPDARQRLLDVGWRIALAVVCGLAVEGMISLALRRPAAALEGLAPAPAPPAPARRRYAGSWTLALRLPILMARLALGLVPVLGFVIAGHLLAASVLGGERLAQLAVLAVIDAYALSVAILRTTRLILIPPRPGLRLFAVPESSAIYAMRWLRRMVVVTVGGYAFAELGLLFGMWHAAYLDLLSLVILFDHACLAVIVLQQRETVRNRICAPAGATGTLASLRDALAATWHWIALTALVALWLVRASEVPGGYTRILYLFIVTGAVLLLCWAMRVRALRSLDRVLTPSRPWRRATRRWRRGLNRYHPLLHATAEAVVYVVATLMLLQLWGLNAFGWLFVSAPGRQLLSTVITVLVTLLLALLAWEAADALTERHLARLAAEGKAARAARLRTLLPMLRTTLLIVILLVAGLMVLSAIGVNTAPMLAGAGIVGLAIGFGSQKLVQDFITGIFLLLENAMQIGDWVTVSGLSGTVEGLSVRTIRLRAGDGSVHVIPFSSVTSVTNTNRGLGNASVSVSVAFAEDTDRVCLVLTEIAAEMRAEPAFQVQMLSDLQLWGVDKVDGAAATIAGQIVCTDWGDGVCSANSTGA